ILELYGRDVFKTDPTHHLRCTMMDDAVSIFGGVKYLEKALNDTIAEGHRKIAVVTTCMPGIIGDDCISVIDRMMKENPGVDIQYVPADGDVSGEYTDGFMMAASNILQSVDLDVKPEKGLVNIIATSFYDIQTKRNREDLEDMLGRFGLRMNCRFLDETTSDNIEGFCRASYDMLLNDTANNRELYELIHERTGRELFPIPLPVGLYDYEEWMSLIGDQLDMADTAKSEIDRVQAAYDSFIEEHRPRFEGKKIMILNKLSFNVDWLIDILLDLRVDLVKVAVQVSGRKKKAELISRHLDIITQDYDSEKMKEDLKVLCPDLIVSDIARPDDGIRFARVGKIGIGLRPALEYIMYLENIMRLPVEEGWKKGGMR
ncbi:MAG: hypothetical protein IKP04_04570, partial [Candidatus Methanomethylophilaceae archaeon]|nr:hypothetical protein [Candidatus Methanomethylophilaceae archaeon]